MRVHVSIHDVSPGTKGLVERALEVCHEFGVRPGLLVVPNFHGEWPLEGDAAFCERLRELEREGHEIFLHGFFHASALPRTEAPFGTPSEARPADQSKMTWFFRQKIVSAGEAEFSAIDEREGRSRLEAGEKILERAGLRISGFVPPAWSKGDWLIRALADRGYRYTETHGRIYDPAERRSRASVVLNFASRSPMRLFSTVAYCRLAKHAARLAPARIAIHPRDMDFALLRTELDRLLRWSNGSVVNRAAELL